MADKRSRFGRLERAVAFNRSVRIFTIVSLSEMTEQEFDSSFLTEDDQSRIKIDSNESILAMRRNKAEDDEVCFRGLEHLRSVAHLEQRKINKECVLQAVLSEQERQRTQQQEEDETNDEEEALADASRTTSKWSCDLALANGASDAARVRSILREDILPRRPRRSRGLALERELNWLCMEDEGNVCNTLNSEPPQRRIPAVTPSPSSIVVKAQRLAAAAAGEEGGRLSRSTKTLQINAQGGLPTSRAPPMTLRSFFAMPQQQL